MEELETTVLNPPSPKKRRPRPPGGTWCVVIVTDSVFVVAQYRPLAVELLKTVVPGGARRFYRSVGPEFFSKFPLNSTQMTWLTEARLFNGTWETLREYRRPILDVLSLEYPEVWLVEGGQSRPYQLPASYTESLSQKYALGPQVVMPLPWARSYSLYCHRHRTWESQPCKDVGLLVEASPKPPAKAVAPGEEQEVRPKSDEEARPKKKKWPSLELHAPQNSLVRASRDEISYYLANAGERIRLGRDSVGETAARQVEDAQRLALVLRAGRAMTATPNHFATELS